MILFKKPGDLRHFLDEKRQSGQSVGWVPTMGALHEGHLSLLDAARASGSITVCSIFVNPTQFNVASDYQHYPITIEQDIKLLEQRGVDLLFLPSVEDIYPEGTTHLEQYDLGFLETVYEGQFRPGHFQGVCQVLSRFIRLIGADDLYMGQKDYQQCMVVKTLLNILGSSTVLHTCPTRREADGLAMSSRNLRLNAGERQQAVAIYEALTTMKKNLRPGPLDELVRNAIIHLEAHAFRVDYVGVARADRLEPVKSWNGQEKLVALVAAFQHDVRLIDNMLLP